MEGSPQTAVQTVYTLSCIKRNCWIIYRHNHPKENKVLKNNIPISDAFFSIFNFHNLIWQFQLLTEKANQEQSSNSTSIDSIFYSFQQNLVHHYNGKMWKRGPPCDFYESAIKFSALGRLSVTRTMEQSRSYTLNTWTLSTDPPPPPPLPISPPPKPSVSFYYIRRWFQSWLYQPYVLLRLSWQDQHKKRSSQSRTITF